MTTNSELNGKPKRYRKLPVEIEAVQWDGSVQEASPIIDWILVNNGTARYHGEQETVLPQSIYIDTLEGSMRAEPNDWIIKGVNGEFYPCKPTIFNKTYEAIDIGDKPMTPELEAWVRSCRGIK